MSGAAPYTPLTPLANHNANDVVEDGFKKARVLYDYDAKDSTELSLMADEVYFLFVHFFCCCVNYFVFQVIFVREICEKGDEDYLIGQRGQKNGKVPKAFLEILGE